MRSPGPAGQQGRFCPGAVCPPGAPIMRRFLRRFCFNASEMWAILLITAGQNRISAAAAAPSAQPHFPFARDQPKGQLVFLWSVFCFSHRGRRTSGAPRTENEALGLWRERGSEVCVCVW